MLGVVYYTTSSKSAEYDGAGDGAMVQIQAFVFDERNDEKITEHGIRLEQVVQLLDGEFLVVPNRKARRAAYLVIGRDWGGTCIAVPIEPTHDPHIWRPVTAWPCKRSEANRLASSVG